MPELSQWLLFSAESIVDSVREPLLVLDADFRVMRANRSFHQTFRVSPDETENRLVYDLGNRQWDIPRLRHLLEEVLPQNASFDGFEVEHTFPAIGRRFLLLNARRMHREGKLTPFILLAFEDVTEQRRAEEQRRELETRFTSLVKNIKDHSIFTMDTAGHVTSWNVEAERILGFSEGEIVGTHFSIIFTPEDVQNGIPGVELRLAREQGRSEDERWHLRKNGERFWALGIVTPTQDAQGRHTGFSKILRDMTDRKRAQEALQQADRRKDEFLAMLAHELRNPLAPIRNSLQIMKMPRVDAPIMERAREVMERQVEQLVRLVDDLMDVSRFVQGKIELRRERVELAAVVARAVETARPIIDAQGHELTTSLPPESLPLEADPVRLAQVVSNLLSNAAKYTEPGGRIWLSARREGDEAVLRVKDNGIGIAPDMLPRVYDIFVQVDPTATRSQGGLGIGLMLVKNLVQLHHGAVEAHSDGLGTGSEFVVRLPLLNQDSGKPEAREKAAEHESRPGRRILVVDDSVDAADSLAMLLRLGGHEVQVAHGGPAAIEMATGFRPEMVFLDIGMPGMDGHEVARRLREQPGLKATVLVALTGWGSREDRCRSAEAGFDHHLVKPVEPKALAALLGDFPLKTRP